MTSSPIPPATDPSAVSSDRLWLRSEIMGTQVITRDTGRRLGVVGEVVVDIDRREVVALGLRDNPLTRFLPGLPRWMHLDRIRQVGDVILVDSVDSLAEGFDPERFSKVINCQVITESGQQLGRVLGFSFDIETGELTTLVISALGIPLLGEGVLSTWELTVGEIVSSGTDRIIVYEGAEDKLKQLGTGLLEKLGIGGESWEQEERNRLRAGMVPAENQLPAGQPEVQQQRRIQPASSRAFQPEAELEYVELEERREREPLRQRRYLDEDSEPRRSGAQAYEPGPYDRDPAGRESAGRDPYEREQPARAERYDASERDREEPYARPPSERRPYGSDAVDRPPMDRAAYRPEPADQDLADREDRLPEQAVSDSPRRRRPLQAERPVTMPAEPRSNVPSRGAARERSAPLVDPIDVEVEPADGIEDPW